MSDNTDSPASNQTHVSIEEYVHLQKNYLESVLTEQSFMIEIKELLDKSIETNARIAELESVLTDCADALEAWVDDVYARGSVPAGYGEKYERDVAVVNAARAALKGEKL